MSKPLRLLLVEDSADDAALLLSALREDEFDVTWERVETAEAMRAALERQSWDCITSDYQMPRFSGGAALHVLKASGLDLPFIIVSGTIGEEVAVSMMKAGAHDYLMKDRLTRLGSAVEHALEECRLRREQREAAAALLESERFNKATLDGLSAHVAIVDEQGCIMAVNEAWKCFAERNGATGATTAIGFNYLEVCDRTRGATAPEAGLVADSIRAVLAGRPAIPEIEYACHGPAERRWFVARITPFPGDGPRRAVVAHENITQRKLAEITLRESEERFRGLIENINDLIAVVDLAGRFEFLSPSVHRLLGYSPEAVLGKLVTDFIHPDDVGIAREGIDRAAANAESKLAEYRIRHSDGRWRVLQSTGRLMPEFAGRKLIVVNSRDVTETRELESQFLRAQRLEAIGTLSSGIAHDLNNILAPMLMATGLLRDDLKNPRGRELLQMIEIGAQRGADIIRQLLTFSRGIEGERVSVQWRHLIKDMVTIARETFPRDISISESVPRSLDTVLGDATQLHQVLLNLCINARDAMPNGGKLTLQARNLELTEDSQPRHQNAKPGAYVVMEVSDTGTGIAPEVIEKIFDPFFTTKELGKGTGLGLSTVLGIVKSHGGFITVQSSLGEGTTFQVYLRADSAAEVDRGSGVEVARARGQQELILLVDDESPIRLATAAALEQANYRVVAAANGEAGLVLFLKYRVEVKLVVTDLMMPVMGGQALIEAIRALDSKIRIIAATGLDAGEKRLELRALGVNTILVKPYTRETLLEAVDAEFGKLGKPT